jgi:DNA-binding PadR family transcriptional regulator
MTTSADSQNKREQKSESYESPCGEGIDVEDLDGAHADLSAFCRDLLRTVAVIEHNTTAQPTGAKIMERIQEDYAREIPHSVYNRLTDLADRGLIEKQHYVAQTKLYRLTSAGKEVLRVYIESIGELLQVFAANQSGEVETAGLEPDL